MKQLLVNYPNKFRASFAWNSSSAVAISFSICAGAEQEPKDLSGISHLIERMLRQGLNSAIAEFGGIVETRTDFEHIEITITTLRQYLEDALASLSNCIFDFNPKFASLEREKAKILGEIEKSGFNPTSILNNLTQKSMYKGTSLATNVLGSAKTISSITLEDVKSYFNKLLSPDSLIISVVGDVFDKQMTDGSVNFAVGGNNSIEENNSKDSIADGRWIIPNTDEEKITNHSKLKTIANSFEQVHDLVNSYFYVRTIQLEAQKKKKKTKYTTPDQNIYIHKSKALNQTRFQISFPSAPYNSAGYKYGKLLEDFLEIYLRVKLANTAGVYGVSVNITQFKENGHISVTFAVDEEKADAIYNKVVSALIQLRTETITKTEFNSLVTKYKTTVVLNHEKITDLAKRFNKWLYMKDKLFKLQAELVAIDSLNYTNFIYILKQTLDFSKMVVVSLGKKLNEFNPFALTGGSK